MLPPFLPESASVWQILPLSLTHAVLSLGHLLVLVAGLHRARRVLAKRSVRRGMDAGTGGVLLGFGARLAREQV